MTVGLGIGDSRVSAFSPTSAPSDSSGSVTRATESACETPEDRPRTERRAATRPNSAAADPLSMPDYDRLGGASVSGDSQELPVPQKAVNLELVKSGGEAYWGVREADGAVIVSQLYDPIQDDPGIRFLTSTAIPDDSRQLRVPDAVYDHWDDVADGGTAVAGGDRLEFVTTEEMAENEQMMLLPEWQVDDVIGGDDS
ncbi:hypothetical protein [Halorussus aquaticus]|uniref:Uncharacterized protein n=1 Tax=Halorussus aquaticus TaxID=2953748 RepID=A0ABD5Q4K4_9EURY|nr:hypothetical protein [Halorussus aquaticus]